MTENQDANEIDINKKGKRRGVEIEDIRTWLASTISLPLRVSVGNNK